VHIEEAVLERDLEREQEQLAARVQIWRFKSFQPELLRRGQHSGRKHFYGIIRIDQTYNQTEAANGFKTWLSEHYRKTKGGGPSNWRAKLNDLVVMRLWHRFPRRKDAIKRVEHVANFTKAGFSGCKEFRDDHKRARREKREVERRLSAAANEEMSRARADALKFFQTLFRGEIPLSYDPAFSGGETWQQPEKRLETS